MLIKTVDFTAVVGYGDTHRKFSGEQLMVLEAEKDNENGQI